MAKTIAMDKIIMAHSLHMAAPPQGALAHPMSSGPLGGRIGEWARWGLRAEEVSMALPEVVSREQWLEARRRLLTEEKELTRRRDALNAKRRELPMVRVEKDYVFGSPDGPVTLADLFGGCRQLVIHHVMFGPDWDAGCPSCTGYTNGFNEALLERLRSRDTAFVMACRAPVDKIEAYRAGRGWVVPWYSSYGRYFL